MTQIGQIVSTEALSWVGTPYRHQASCKGAGTDCLGLLLGIWRMLYGTEPERVPAYSADWSEPQGREDLLEAAQRHLVAQPLGQVQIGDVLLFRMRERSVAKHLGIQTGIGDKSAFVHAYSGHGVTRSPFSEPWSRRLAARFSFPA